MYPAQVVRGGLCGRVVRVSLGLCGGLCEGCVVMAVQFQYAPVSFGKFSIGLC